MMTGLVFDLARQLRYQRNKALLLLGFWRGFRGDELTSLRVENVNAIAGEGMRCFLPLTKGDRQAIGTTFRAPALASLCPVEAYLAYLKLGADGVRLADQTGRTQGSKVDLCIYQIGLIPCTIRYESPIAYWQTASESSPQVGFLRSQPSVLDQQPAWQRTEALFQTQSLLAQ